MKKALFPGTFDPPTLGHLDIINRAANLCNKLYIGIANNLNKPDKLFTLAEKQAMLNLCIKNISNVEVVTFSGLVVECAKAHDVDCIIRGLRSFSDFEYELQMALANHKMTGIETIFLPAAETFSHISSTLIREIASYGGPLQAFVSAEIEQKIQEKLKASKPYR